MSGHRSLVCLLALLLVGWAVLRLVVATERRGPGLEQQGTHSTPSSRPAAEVAVPMPTGTSPAQERVPATRNTPETVPAPDAPPSTADGVGAFSLLIEDTEEHPLAGIRIVAVLDGEEGQRELRFVDAPRGDRATAVLSDFLGHAKYFLPSGRAGALRIWSETPGYETRTVAFGPLAAGEERSLAIRLRSLDDAGLAGHVVDGGTGEPIAGALVLVRQEGRSLDGTETDAEGRFRIDWQGWLDVHLRVEAEGYSPALLVLSHAEVPEPIPLWRAATLVLAVTNHLGTSLGRLSLRLDGALSDALPLALRMPGLRAETFTLDSSTRANGFARIEGLPVTIPLEILLKGEPFRRARVPLAPFAPGEVRRLDWRSGQPTTVRGRLVDQDGLAVPGEDIWIRSPFDMDRELWVSGQEAPPAGRYFTKMDRAAVLHTSTSGPDGSFLFENVYPGEVLIGPAFGSGSVAPWARLTEIEDRGQGEPIVLSCSRDLFASGVVVDVAGNQQTGSVFATHEGGGFYCDSNPQPFVLGPLIDDVHVFQAHDSMRLSEPVSKRPWKRGQEVEGLVLVLQAVSQRKEGRISGIVVDPVNGRGLSASVTAYEANAAPSFLDWRTPMDVEKRMTMLLQAYSSSAPTNGLGGFEIDSLAPGAYVLVAREPASTVEDARTMADLQGSAVGLARAVIPGRGDRVADVTIRIPRPASAVARLPAGTWGGGDYWASIDGMVVSQGTWRDDDPFPIPSGRITLDLTEELSGRRVFRSLDAPPGGTISIEMENDER